MKFFSIDTAIDNEYRFYDIQGGNVFFILKEKSGENWEEPKYYTSQLFEYDTIEEELKDWSIEIIKKNPKAFLEDLSFNYNKVIKPMFKRSFRDSKLTQLGIT
jgi:hypothetical protein